MSKRHATQFTMTVREVLQLPSFESSVVIAGQESLDRTVSNAMILEGADIEKWGRSGTLLITSLYALDPLSAREKIAFIEKASDIGISGIVFKPNRVSKVMPPDLLAKCADLHIPVIEICPQTKYESILMEVMGGMLDGNLTLLNKFFNMHGSVTKLALGQPSTHGILSELKRNLGLDATFYNRTNNICIPTDPRYTTFDTFDLTEMERGPYQTFHYYRVKDKQGGRDRSLAVLIPSQNHVAAYLVIHADPSALDTLDFMSVENYVTLLQMEMLKQNAIEDALYQHNSTAVHDLLHNRYSTREAIDHALKELSIDTLPLYQTMLVRFHIKDTSQRSRLRDLISGFNRSVQRNYSHLVVYINDNRVVFLRNLSNVSQEFQPAVIEEALRGLHANADMPEFTHFVALSNSYERYDINRAHSEVMGMFRLFELNKDINRCLLYQDFGIYKLFLHVEDIKDIETYIDSKVARLIKNNPAFFETVAVLCERDLNYNEAARVLCVHPKTVHYRINRVRDLYGIDIHDMEDVAQVLISEKILTLIGRNWRSTGELNA